MRTFKEQIVEVAKGVISPADLRIGGDLTSQAASSVISLIEKTDFFSKITTERMTKLSKDIEVLDILPDQLVRVAQGAEATDDQKVDISEYGCVMTSLPIQLFADIKMDTLRDNADNPQLLNIINGMFTTRFQNDLNKLGFQGTADTGATFLTLCKGWWQIATDSVHKKTATIDPANWIDSLAAVQNAADERFEIKGAFIMNPKDSTAYALELGKLVIGKENIANKGAYNFMGTPIIRTVYMPRNKVMFTDPKNLVLGLSTNIRRDVEWHARKRVLEFTFDWAVDFEIKVKHAVVLGTTA